MTTEHNQNIVAIVAIETYKKRMPTTELLTS